MALTEYNGDNETNIQLSRSLTLSVYQNEAFQEINVINQANLFDMWISRDRSIPIQSFSLVNAVSSNASLLDGFYVSGFNLNYTNVSIHIQLKPLNKQLSYLAMIKFGQNPLLSNYDVLYIFCPNDLIVNSNTSFYYMLFANMSTVNNFQGYVGFSFKELNTADLNCLDKTKNSPNYLQNLSTRKQNFSSNFELRTFLSGCYFTDPLTSKWSTRGIEILSDTNLTHTHCQSNHLTTFAGGLIVLPNAINFDYVWSHASSFTQNVVVYCTVISLVTLYVLLGIWARFMDRRDSQKIGLTLLIGDSVNDIENKYIYEIIVFTGARFNASTSSKV